jgi:8-oxo-dGTP pyrophosphatase MutT (NUDIX family)
VLWRQLPQPQALTERLERLKSTLANRAPTPADDDPDLRWAAVAVILVPSPDSLLLIRRAARVGDPWSGHVALPGGRRDAGDADLADTAMREVNEEVGVALDTTRLIATLPDVIPRTPTLPPVAVRPFLFLLPSRPSLTPNSEVAGTEWVPLDRLLEPTAHQVVQIDTPGGAGDVPAYVLPNLVIWGMTERILSALFEELRSQES